MIKSLGLLVRKDGVSHDAFMHHWTRVHAPMHATIPGIRGYILSEVILEPSRPDIPVIDLGYPIDGVAELWWDDDESRRAALEQPEVRAWYADGATFIKALRSYVTVEEPVIPLKGPRPPIKNISLLRRRAGVTSDAFHHNWREAHAPMARDVPEIRGFSTSRILEEISRPDLLPIDVEPIDGIALSWIDDLAAREAMSARPATKAWHADGAASFGAIKMLVTRETVFVEPPR